MKLIHPSGDEALACLRAMRTVTTEGGAIPPAVRALMTAAQRLIMSLDVDLDTLQPITPSDVAAAVTTPGMAEQLVGALMVGVLADGEPDPAAFKRLQSFAAALGVDMPAVNTVRLLVERHMVLFRLDFTRRSLIADMVKNVYSHHGGIRGAAAALLGQRGLYEDKDLAERFIALGQLPEGTLGHAYFMHCRSNGFPFPGEREGFPITGVWHDMAHVLGGYDSEPEGELQVGAFTAGFKKHNPMYMILLVSLLWGAGVKVVPGPRPYRTGTLAKDDMAEKFIHAIERGSRVNTDLSDNWDFWPLMPLPLDEARARLGITA